MPVKFDEELEPLEPIVEMPEVSVTAEAPRRHCTYLGRVVYNRPKHYFTQTDVDRIVHQLTPTKPKPEKDFPFFWRIINWLADYMLDRILGVLGVKDEGATTLWRGIMLLWGKFMEKIGMTDPMHQRLLKLYENSYYSELSKWKGKVDKGEIYDTWSFEGLLLEVLNSNSGGRVYGEND